MTADGDGDAYVRFRAVSRVAWTTEVGAKPPPNRENLPDAVV
jgi:hypothetical protein